MKERLYNHGLPFSENLARNLDAQMERIKNKKASMIITDGQVGEGKTTLSVELADYINSKHDLPEIDLKKKAVQYAYGGSDFTEKLRLCYRDKLPVCIYDEAGDFNKRGSLSRFNAMLNRTFETFRAFKVIVILSLPSFHVLDNDLFTKGIPRLLLHCHNRGHKYGDFSGYGLYRQFYLKEAMRKAVCKPLAFKFTRPNFRGHFLDISKIRSKQLDHISTSKKLKELKEQELALQNLITYVQISEKLNMSIDWVRRSTNKLKIKSIKEIKKVKYFDKEIINRLADFLDEGGLGDKNKKD